MVLVSPLNQVQNTGIEYTLQGTMYVGEAPVEVLMGPGL